MKELFDAKVKKSFIAACSADWCSTRLGEIDTDVTGFFAACLADWCSDLDTIKTTLVAARFIAVCSAD